jgi:hypothetical protein
MFCVWSATTTGSTTSTRGQAAPEGGYDLCSRCGREKKSYKERGNPAFGGSLPGGPPL